MAELPEVETIKNDLRALVVGRRITGVAVADPTLVRYPSPEQFGDELRGTEIVGADRRAKYLLIRLSGGAILVVQLMITGQLLLLPPSAAPSKSTRLILDLDTGQQLRLVDSSHYARVNLVCNEEELYRHLPLGELGPEGIAPDLTRERFTEMLAGRRAQIKALLLDQRFLAGLGNIYVDESLFAARIHPARRANTLTPEEAARLYDAFRRILGESIARRGTTIRSYKDVLGRKGGYQEHLQVVMRAGKPCLGCPGQLAKLTVAGRETYYCPNCQRSETPQLVVEAGPTRAQSASRRSRVSS